jgi:hypothetical protein
LPKLLHRLQSIHHPVSTNRFLITSCHLANPSSCSISSLLMPCLTLLKAFSADPNNSVNNQLELLQSQKWTHYSP